MTIGEQIKAMRKKAGYTQKELAEKSGVAMVSIQQYERGVRSPRIEQLQRIAKALNISVGDLLGLKKVFAERVDTKEIVSEGYMTIEDIQGPYDSNNKKIVYLESEEALLKYFKSIDSKRLLIQFFNTLNIIGQYKAVERVKELTEIPHYRRKPAEIVLKPTETALEGKDTTPDETPTETAHNSPEDETKTQ